MILIRNKLIKLNVQLIHKKLLWINSTFINTYIFFMFGLLHSNQFTFQFQIKNKYFSFEKLPD